MELPPVIRNVAIQLMARVEGAISIARQVEEAPNLAIGEYIATKVEWRYEKTKLCRCHFDTTELGDDVPIWPWFHEIGAAVEMSRVESKEGRLARDPTLEFYFKAEPGERPRIRRVHLLSESGSSSQEAIDVVRAWATDIVKLGSAILNLEPQLPRPSVGISERAFATYEALRDAYPAGRTADQLAIEVAKRLGIKRVHADSVRKTYIPALCTASVPIVNDRRGYVIVASP